MTDEREGAPRIDRAFGAESRLQLLDEYFSMMLPRRLIRDGGEFPQSTLHVFENSGHFPFVEEHAEYVLVVGRWLSGIDSRLRG